MSRNSENGWEPARLQALDALFGAGDSMPSKPAISVKTGEMAGLFEQNGLEIIPDTWY
jgi:hypothetical protein